MKKLIIFAFLALGMIACTGKNTPNTPTEMREGFSVSPTIRVRFSQGNLQYKASSNTWRFAENQFDTIGAANKNISKTYSGWIDLFGWGTGNNPTLTSNDANDYQTFTDWGVNPISNGGNKAYQWRTLTSEEWIYLFKKRTNAANLFGLGSVHGVNGVIILPDAWTTPSSLEFCASTKKGLTSFNSSGDAFYDNTSGNDHFLDNVYTYSEWAKMEAAGAIFLPAAGRRTAAYNGTVEVSRRVGQLGNYHSATPHNGFYYLYFDNRCLDPGDWNADGTLAFSVRLVQDIE